MHTNHEYASQLLRRYIANTEKTLVLVQLERDQKTNRICINNGLHRFLETNVTEIERFFRLRDYKILHISNESMIFV